MAKQGKKRTMSICLTDIPKEKILIHENGKKYLMIETWDNDEPDKYDNDFSVSISFFVIVPSVFTILILSIVLI
jgi:hypothetical protein